VYILSAPSLRNPLSYLEFLKNAYYLHSNQLVHKADILILARVIYPYTKNTDQVSFFERISSVYEKIYWLPGNHEFYLGDIAKFIKYKEIKVKIIILKIQYNFDRIFSFFKPHLFLWYTHII
jgi:hypothetical protein